MDQTCKGAAVILRTLDLDTEYARLRGTPAGAALAHYADCPACRPAGLAAIMLPAGRMDCHEAIRVALGNSSLLYSFMSSGIKTLREVVAHEHIYGVHTYRERDGQMIDPNPKFGGELEKACRELVCSRTRDIWNNAPLCSHYDGDKELERGPYLVLKLASEARWQLEPLVASLRKRLHAETVANDREPLAIMGARAAFEAFAQLELAL
jgi:hypothetical protein